MLTIPGVAGTSLEFNRVRQSGVACFAQDKFNVLQEKISELIACSFKVQTTMKNLLLITFGWPWFAMLAACQQLPVSTEKIEQTPQVAVEKGCKPLSRNKNLIPIVTIARGGGEYCLVEDLVQRNVRALDNGQNVGSPRYNGIVMFHRAHDMKLDLQGHLVSGEPFINTAGIRAPTPDNDNGSNIKIFNGDIFTPGVLSIGVYMGYLWVGGDIDGNRPTGTRPYREDDEPKHGERRRENSHQFDPLPHSYSPPTRFTAEGLRIQSGGRGIVMVGADNVVRNNVIEVDSKVAVYLYGPRPIIEGNTFIVRLSEKDTTTLPAILKLRDADGAIIRNNKFIVKPDVLPWKTPGKAEAAINLLTSKNVLIENNTVMDTRQLLRKDEASTAEERGNVLQ